jgi:hypothetical protein
VHILYLTPTKSWDIKLKFDMLSERAAITIDKKSIIQSVCRVK